MFVSILFVFLFLCFSSGVEVRKIAIVTILGSSGSNRLLCSHEGSEKKKRLTYSQTLRWTSETALERKHVCASACVRVCVRWRVYGLFGMTRQIDCLFFSLLFLVFSSFLATVCYFFVGFFVAFTVLFQQLLLLVLTCLCFFALTIYCSCCSLKLVRGKCEKLLPLAKKVYESK